MDDGCDGCDGCGNSNVGRFPPDVNPKSHTMRKKLNYFFFGRGCRLVIHQVIYIYEKHGS